MTEERSGYITLPRRIEHDPIWLGQKFSQAHAWLDLVLSARWGDGRIMRGVQMVDVQAGQALVSQRELGRRWRWDIKTVRRFMALLVREGRMSMETYGSRDSGYTLITIGRYAEDYQAKISRDHARPDLSSKERSKLRDVSKIDRDHGGTTVRDHARPDISGKERSKLRDLSKIDRDHGKGPYEDHIDTLETPDKSGEFPKLKSKKSFRVNASCEDIALGACLHRCEQVWQRNAILLSCVQNRAGTLYKCGSKCVVLPHVQSRRLSMETRGSPLGQGSER